MIFEGARQRKGEVTINEGRRHATKVQGWPKTGVDMTTWSVYLYPLGTVDNKNYFKRSF